MGNEEIIKHADMSNFSTPSEWLCAASELVGSCNASEALTFIRSLRFEGHRIPKQSLCAALQIAFGFADLFCIIDKSSHEPVPFSHRDALSFILTTMFVDKYSNKLRYLDKYIDALDNLHCAGVDNCDVAQELFLRGYI